MPRTCLPLAVSLIALLAPPLRGEPLSGTKELTEKGDLPALMVQGIDKYLMRELEGSTKKREEYWKVDLSSVDAYLKSVAPKRERLKKLVGAIDERVPFTDLEYVAGPKTPALVAETDDYKVYTVRWPVLPGVDGEGLLLEPKGKIVGYVVTLPDADWTPEMLVGLAPGVSKDHQFARRFAENGCRVLVPVLIDRKDSWSGNPKLEKWTNQPHREFIYRMAFEMGRHIIGYEVQKVLAAVDWFSREKDHPPIGVMGYGEGALIAYCSKQIDPRIRVVCVSGYRYFMPDLWAQPIYRNVWGLLPEFDNTNRWSLTYLIGPGPLLGVAEPEPTVTGPPSPRPGRTGAAPGVLPSKFPPTNGQPHPLAKETGAFGMNISVGENANANAITNSIQHLTDARADLFKLRPNADAPADRRKDFDPAVRQKRQFDQLVAFTQKLMRDSESVRQKDFWGKLDLSSPEKYKTSCKPLRERLWTEVIGKLPKPTLPMNPRSRQVYDEPKWKGYEVVLDLYPDVFAYGILLLPKDLKAGEKRPVVVCQHGLEGTPRSCIDAEKRRTYNQFAGRLADLGYIVYCPQNPYIGQDKFRVLQRKANPLGLSLFSFIVRQHERTLDWLATLPNVDAERIAFYGLSYGGKTAMRVPALLPRYCLSICSGDFNEWIWKNVSYDFKGSYLFTGEYEMPEFNLGNTFGYAEMAALIAPRPFMVERGHDDGVGIDEWVAYEYAKVQRHYSRLKIPDKTEIEFFDGVHEIHGVGTFRFLKKHLGWPKDEKK
jgi:dienelactone hydrolase